MLFGIDLWSIIIVVAVILFSMTLHEAMHAYVSYWLGDDTAKAQGRLTLNPVSHIDPFLTLILPITLLILGLPVFGGAKPVPFNPSRVRYGDLGAALVGVAGPLTNLVIAFVLFVAYILTGLSIPILLLATTINLGFFIFNMLPIPPLDGSRALYALAPEAARRVMEAIERYGVFLIFAIVLVASPLIGTFIRAAMNFILGVFSAPFGVHVGLEMLY